MKMSQMNIQVGMDTDVLSLTVRAIAKHAKALAEELDGIDSDKCNMCGSIDVEKAGLGIEDTILEEWVECLSCGWSSRL